MIKGILVTTAGEIKPAELDGSLDGYYEALECDIIDCTVRRIGNKEYDIICDDEGLCKENPKVTAVTTRLEPALVGNLFICNHDEEGNWTSLTMAEMNQIRINNAFVFDSELGIRKVIQVWI